MQRFRLYQLACAVVSCTSFPLVAGDLVSLAVLATTPVCAMEAASTKVSKSLKDRSPAVVNVFERFANRNIVPEKKSVDQQTDDDNAVDKKEADNVPTIETQRAKAAFRYSEDIAPGLKFDMDLHAILHSSTSAVQSVQVLDTYFGRTLATDGKTQSAEHDEFVYHESLVHPPLFWSAYLSERSGGAAPKTVFIGGGGELATAREVLKHNTIERVVMVDIDPEVIEVSRKYLPEWGGDAVFNHPKLEYIIGDVEQYLRGTNEQFDAIILDVSDPIEAGPAVSLYTQEFYRVVAARLKQNGVFVTQAGSASFVPFPHSSFGDEVKVEEGGEDTCFGPIKNTLATIFDHAVPYSTPVASFGEDWGFVLAFNGPADYARAVADLPHEVIDDLIEERIQAVPGVPEHACRSPGVKRAVTGNEKGSDALKHYDGVVHRRSFALSKPLREAMKGDQRVMTEANPIFMY